MIEREVFVVKSHSDGKISLYGLLDASIVRRIIEGGGAVIALTTSAGERGFKCYALDADNNRRELK